jgi:hypothetical protein
MSSNLAYSSRRPVEDLVEEQNPRRVQIVTTRAQRRARPKIVYAIVAIAVIFAIFLAQLLLTIALSGGAYAITKLQNEQVNYGRVASSLNEQLDTVASTQNLAANAKELGMVASSGQAFLRLSDDKVLGNSARAQGSTGGSNSAADSSVPNSLLAGVPLVKVPTSGHGAANPTNSTGNASQSNSSGTTSKSPASDSGSTGSTGTGSTGTGSTGTGTGTGSTGSTGLGDLPSPVTH